MGLSESDFLTPAGYEAYQARGGRGAPRHFETADELHTAALDYFRWAMEHPLPVTKAVTSNGKAHLMEVPNMRPFSLKAMCLHMGISPEYWFEMRKNRVDLSYIIGATEDMIANQKFEGAVVGLFNSSIISRDLGLIDKQEVTISTPDMTEEEQRARLEAYIPQIAPVLISMGWTPPGSSTTAQGET